MALELPTIRVSQWLDDWDTFEFDASSHRSLPPKHFIMFSIKASLLRRLSGVSRRSKDIGRGADIGIQRGHDKRRSAEIREYVRSGYPWSTLSEAKRASGKYIALKKPGWLPTAVVVNLLTPDDERRGIKADPTDLAIAKTDGSTLQLPPGCERPDWSPTGALHPIEVIDGQHRLFAFSSDDGLDDYELPVVAFVGLDISWQAYLFWTINIKPKRINPSLAFDLYPLLRTESWLEQADGLAIYRETRAQELVESIWLSQDSPWHDRINMLGETGLAQPMVSQAAWIRALTSTFVRAGEGQRVSIGGLFGASHRTGEDILPWTRPQQAAFLVCAGRLLQTAIEDSDAEWAEDLRELASVSKPDPAFYGPYSLLTTDQGIRGFLHAFNDICFLAADDVGLDDWGTAEDVDPTDVLSVSIEFEELASQPFFDFMRSIASGLASFDWRASSTPSLTPDQQLRKAVLRGSGGYKELRKQVLLHIADDGSAASPYADQALGILGYD